MARVDPTGVQARLRRTVWRRAYSVPMPNSVWHIDGYHKLIRWQIIIQGGIDGYSRLPVYLVASNNNRSDTVLKAFLRAVNSFGLPSPICCVGSVYHTSLVHSEHTELHSVVGDPGESSEYGITVLLNPIEEQLTQVGILDLLYAIS